MVLNCVTISDLRHLVISNRDLLCAIAIFLAVAPGLYWEEIALCFAVASGVFPLGLVFGWLG